MLIAVNEKTHTTTFDMFAVNFIFYSEWAQCLQAQWFLFGLPRHFHLLLCNCLVYRYLYFVVNNNKYLIIYVLLTEFEVRAVSYKPSFSPSIYGPRAAINRRGKNEDPWLTVRTEKTRLVRCLLDLYFFYVSVLASHRFVKPSQNSYPQALLKFVAVCCFSRQKYQPTKNCFVTTATSVEPWKVLSREYEKLGEIYPKSSMSSITKPRWSRLFHIFRARNPGEHFDFRSRFLCFK